MHALILQVGAPSGQSHKALHILLVERRTVGMTQHEVAAEMTVAL